MRRRHKIFYSLSSFGDAEPLAAESDDPLTADLKLKNADGDDIDGDNDEDDDDDDNDVFRSKFLRIEFLSVGDDRGAAAGAIVDTRYHGNAN